MNMNTFPLASDEIGGSSQILYVLNWKKNSISMLQN